jgi:hypothetical protein
MIFSAQSQASLLCASFAKEGSTRKNEIFFFLVVQATTILKYLFSAD